MVYSVMVWLVDPGESAHELEEQLLEAGTEAAPGAKTGSNIGPALPRMVYGVYEEQEEAENALREISENLQSNAPVRISSQAPRVFLVPAQRVHYVVCQEVERPKD